MPISKASTSSDWNKFENKCNILLQNIGGKYMYKDTSSSTFKTRRESILWD